MRHHHPVGDEKLKAAGIGTFDERVYRVLLTRTSATAAELMPDLGDSQARVTKALGRLHDLGLVGQLAGEGKRFAAIDPASGVEALVRDQERALDLVRVAARELGELYRHGAGGRQGDEIEIVHGPEALGRRFVQLQQETTEEFMALDRPPYVLATENPVEERALDRGVRYRVVYSPEALAHPIVGKDIERLVRAGEDARMLTGVRVKLAIADRSTALLPLSLDVGDGLRAAIIHQSTLLDALVDYWELCWQQAIPFGAEVSGELTDDDRALLTLLVAGLKDDAIARQLGWSLRTMRRRVRRLHELTGTSNRFQAGAVAMRRGWL
jgi:sugar-specific transcriptional regulator TrmB/DNA-binding CsgD family transcriptional regulator